MVHLFVVGYFLAVVVWVPLCGLHSSLAPFQEPARIILFNLPLPADVPVQLQVALVPPKNLLAVERRGNLCCAAPGEIFGTCRVNLSEHVDRVFWGFNFFIWEMVGIFPGNPVIPCVCAAEEK